jgi:hypothetical protein
VGFLCRQYLISRVYVPDPTTPAGRIHAWDSNTQALHISMLHISMLHISMLHISMLQKPKAETGTLQRFPCNPNAQ